MTFVKGKSGNPKKQFSKENQPKNPDGSSKAGRKRLLPDLNEAIAEALGEEMAGLSGTAAIIMSLRKKAIHGKGSEAIRAAELLLKYGYGGPVQHVDLTSKGQAINEIKDKRPVVKMPDGNGGFYEIEL